MVVTLSYYEAGRRLDAQETVEQVPAPPEVVDWVRGFVAEHYGSKPKRRGDAESSGRWSFASAIRQREDPEEAGPGTGSRAIPGGCPTQAGGGRPADEQVEAGSSGGREHFCFCRCEPAWAAHLAPEPPLLTLADAQALTIDSDFRPFVARDVAPE